MKKILNKYNVITLLLLLSTVMLLAQNSSSQEEGEEDKNKKEKWNFGVLPSILYNTDLGFQYGGIVNAFDYRDAIYPEYKNQLYAEWSRTTKGGGINQLYWETKKLFGTELEFETDLSYLTQKAMDFYGFNGYETVFNNDFEETGSTSYISRMFYKYERKMFRSCITFRGPIAKNLFWLGGGGYYDFKIGTVDIDRLNRGKEGIDSLPDTDLLYDKYVEWGIINQRDKNGGAYGMLYGGIAFDTRDNESNPMKGIWTEVMFAQAISFSHSKASFTKLAITHRQYFTLIPKNLSLAYRVAWQGKIAGYEPWYMHSYMFYSKQYTTTVDGLGGSKTIRGILRDRVVGEGVAYANIELRWKFIYFDLFKQNFYLSLNAFTDMGMVVDKVDVDKSKVPAVEYEYYFSDRNESLHATYGGGLCIVMNRNFVISANYGKTFDKQDGASGFYIGLNYLF